MSEIPTTGPSKEKMTCWLAGGAFLILATCFFCAVSGPAAAALHDRGNGLIYDDVLDVTWAQDVNLAGSQSFDVSGIAADGTMNWYTAQAWIAAMNSAGGTGYLGFNDWRLPRVRPVNGTEFVFFELDPDSRQTASYTGGADVGFNISAPGSRFPGTVASEVPHVYYNSLANLGNYSVNGTWIRTGSIWSWTVNAAGGFTNPGPFTNWGTPRAELDPPVQPYIWLDSRWPTPSGVTCVENPGAPVTGDQVFDGCTAWVFNVAAGFQAGAGASNFPASAWAVRDGDVSPIPEPASTTLLIAGLGCLFARRRLVEAFWRMPRSRVTTKAVCRLCTLAMLGRERSAHSFVRLPMHAVGFGFSLTVALVSVNAHAALLLRDITGAPTSDPRSAEFAYDSVLDATWYLTPLSPGLPWASAKSWATTLVVGAFDDWRLPSALNLDGTGPCVAWGCQSPMGMLWGPTLGNGTNGVGQPGLRVRNLGPFKNLVDDAYWLADEYSGNAESAWYFDFAFGSQGAAFKDGARYAIAIRTGDVALIPEPSNAILMLAGLLSFACVVMARKAFRLRGTPPKPRATPLVPAESSTVL
jgi:hypothetical protein